MTKRSPVSSPQPIWYDSQQVDETDLQLQQTADNSTDAAIVNNHIGSGVLPEALVPNILFDSSLVSGTVDGKNIQPQAQPSDNTLGNQLKFSLFNSDVSIYRTIKVAVFGLDFQNNLQYETFIFKSNGDSTVSIQHFTKILLILINDLSGAVSLSLNLGGTLVISEASPMTLSSDPLMIAQNTQPSLFFRDFYIDPSTGFLSLNALLQAALPFYNINSLGISTEPLDNLILASGDVSTQIGQKFQATTNNIEKITFLLSVQNQIVGQQDNLVWTGDLVMSIYPLQTTITCPTDILPNSAINFTPSNIPVAQITFNYNSLQNIGVVLDGVPQPIDFIFSNSSTANGTVIIPNNYYAITLKRAGVANQCDILMAVGNAVLTNSLTTTFTGEVWVDLPTENLWFEVWTDSAKVSDGQAYDTGNGVIIPKTILDPETQSTIDYNFNNKQFLGNQNYVAVLTAVDQPSDPVPDARTGNPVFSRQELVPQVNLLNPIDLSNLEKTTDPIMLGSIADKNIKAFNQTTASFNSKLYSATIVNNNILIRIVDDPTDTGRFDTSVVGLASSLLNGQLVGAKIIPDATTPSLAYRISQASLCSMIVGDVDGNGVIDENDLSILNSYIGFDFNTSLPQHTLITTDGYTSTTFTNGYITLTQPFINLFSVQFQLILTSTGDIVASGTDGVLIANPTNNRLAQFTSASVSFTGLIGLSSYQLVILNTSVNEANTGGFDIVGLDSTDDVITLNKVFLDSDVYGQMMRADIDEDFSVSVVDGYLLDNYIQRNVITNPPAPIFPAPTTNAYNKIGTRFNLIKLELENFIDRTDDYDSDPNNRASVVHPLPDIFLADGYFASHNFYSSPIPMNFTQQLIWDDSLIAVSSKPQLVPSVFTSETNTLPADCSIEGTTCNTYPVVNNFDPGTINYFVPNNLILGEGNLIRPDGYFYKVDFEVGTIILEIPPGLFGNETTIDIFNSFVVDATGSGITKQGFPALRFADCSTVQANALALNQVRFSVGIESFSPNTNGLSQDGYEGIVVDGTMGVNIDYSTGLLTVNFTNLYQDPVLQTLSTKIQVNVFLKKAGFNNQTLFVNSVQVGNLLKTL